MKTKGIDLDELRALVATLDALEGKLSQLSSMRGKNGSYCILRLVGLDEKEVQLLCQEGYMDGNQDDWEAFDAQSVCRVPASLILNKDIPLDVRVDLARGWTNAETEESKQLQTISSDQVKSVTTTIRVSQKADAASNSGHDSEPDHAPEAH